MTTLAIITKKGEFQDAVIEVYETWTDAIGGYMVKGLSRSKTQSNSYLCFKNSDCAFVTVGQECKINYSKCPSGTC